MMNVDPRLQSFSFSDPSFAFPSHPASAQFDPNVNAYGLNLDQQPTAHPAVTSPRRATTRHAAQGSSQTRIHGAQAAALNQQVPSPSNSQPTSPRRPPPNGTTPKQNRNGLVFKNSTSAYPQGGSAVNANSNIFAVSSLPQPPSNLHNNTSADYFSTPDTQAPTTSITDAEPSLPTPPPTNDSANPFSSTFPLITDPPQLSEWRGRLFNIETPIHLTQSQFLTYFPHIDNVYSHRSTQRYKRKPFLSHYWDCRLKGRPSGTKKSQDPNIKRRKREKRELGLCDVKIKITEWFGREEAEQMGLNAVALGEGEATFDGVVEPNLHFVVETDSPNGARLQTSARWPKGHPGADGKKWYTIQRVNVGGKKGDEENDEDEDDAGDDSGEGRSLDHKHTLEESDRIKKNSVQRQMLKEEKDRRNSKKAKLEHSLPTPSHTHTSSISSLDSSSYLASGPARQTVRLHAPTVATHLTFYANAFCPFAQRVWIALELKNIPYQLVEITPEMLKAMDNNKPNTSPSTNPIPKDLLSVNPDAIIPCIKHGNWGIWESNVMMEYLEDLFLDMGQNVGGIPLLPVGQPQLKAHCRLWVDHVNRKVLPAFYALLLSPPPRHQIGDADADANIDEEERRQDAVRAERLNVLMDTLQAAITKLVNASHAIGPFFLGDTITYVDVAFAPWILRLSRVLSYYRNFPRPEVGTRWQSWVDAIEADERVRRTVSDEKSYHGVYRGVGEDGVGVGLRGVDMFEDPKRKVMVEMGYARKIMSEEGFGLGGDLYGKMGLDSAKFDVGRR